MEERLPNRCGFIRWKGLFIDVQADTSGSSQGGDHIYWCLLTQNCLGPDGQIVDEQTCNAFRSCYQEM